MMQGLEDSFFIPGQAMAEAVCPKMFGLSIRLQAITVMTLLKIYALFKQGSTGDATGDRPGMTDFVGRAKFDAWAGLKGTTQETAMQQYIDLINELKG